jgi:hypothetical protein
LIFSIWLWRRLLPALPRGAWRSGFHCMHLQYALAWPVKGVGVARALRSVYIHTIEAVFHALEPD